jgi:phage terminase small subunit
VLVSVAKKSESDSARVAAANAILDRGYGKPRQAVEHSGSIGTYDLTKLDDDALDKLESILGPLAHDGGDQGGEEST